MTSKIQRITSEYANLWADVLYNRRLPVHLHRIEHDISLVGLLITLSYFRNRDVRPLERIKEDLIMLRNIIRQRL
ncbi:hypothetical protein SAMN06265348_102157 [Pedobacter westerhofensis]|uniref:Uncharacterized protein n=1 Tax=Pedobacter westerhofensis TaxID=425512 RepID=A0A521BBI4_9SPHI|nr:hypothetical protein [Pedobacter westerhofensis]SMO44351.1 hypothetical protein SAMN06265348_102157 [Pedobacter westerhofensis]